LDVSIRQGIVRIYVNDELKVEENVSQLPDGNYFFKTGIYHRGIESHAVEFESLSIATP